MPTLFHIDNLTPGLRKMVLKQLSGAPRRLWNEDALLTYRQAGLLYGFTYQTIRHYVSIGAIKTVGEGHYRKRITHAAMREYEATIAVHGRRRRKSEIEKTGK